MLVWADYELEFIRQRIGKPTVKEIFEEYVEEFGSIRTYDSVQKKVQQMRAAFTPGEPQVATIEEVLDSLDKALNPNRRLVPVSQEEKNELKEDKNKLLEELLEYTKLYKFPPDIRIPPVQSSKSSLVIELSDLHFGQHGPSYDTEVATDRVISIPHIIKQQIYEDIDEVVVLMMGDMVEGEDIFPTQPHHISCSTREQIGAASKALIRMLNDTANLFKCPVRIICVPGNHGRVSKTTNEKTNWDNILYMFLGILIESSEYRLSMETTGDPFLSFNVKDIKGLITHEAVKHTGTPAFREKVAGWVYNKKCQFICGGHYHEWKVGSWQDTLCFGNGCLNDPNNLSERISQESPARQGFFIVTPGQPINHIGFVEFKPLKRVEDNEIPSNTKEFEP